MPDPLYFKAVPGYFYHGGNLPLVSVGTTESEKIILYHSVSELKWAVWVLYPYCDQNPWNEFIWMNPEG